MEGGRETLADASEKEVNRLLNRKKRKKIEDAASPSSKRCIWTGKDAPVQVTRPSPLCGAPAARPETFPEINVQETNEKQVEIESEDDIDWETGPTDTEGWDGNVTFEVEATPSKKPTRRRATAKDKEYAELVHKAHLLCVLARGRLVDAACDDPMLRASVLSIIPARLKPPCGSEKLKVAQLQSLTKWFNGMFRLVEGSCGDLNTRLSEVLAKQNGSEEELAAMAVAIFRSLGLTTRYVCVLDVTSLKPDAESLEASKGWKGDERYMQTALSDHIQSFISTPSRVPVKEASPVQTPQPRTEESSSHKTAEPPVEDTPVPAKRKRNSKNTPKKSSSTAQTPAKPQSARTRRKGDEEFELELARAIAATEGSANVKKDKAINKNASLAQKQDTPNVDSNVVKNTNMVHWSRKQGPLLHWAEVYCGTPESGRWIHVDTARNIVDGPENVEACASRQPVRYVVAFSSMGAKDVTRRYTTAWSKISGLRVEQAWWDRCIFPLREIEASTCRERSTKEDMELETKAYTEPLPTNQQAYRNHHLYALERWLTRYQTLYPKGPIIGSCGGKPVYPRSCVQDLHTKERWLREGFAVKQGEQPVKSIKSRHNNSTPRKQQTSSDNIADEELTQAESSLVELYGKWQTEPWEPPPVVNGVVPRNERGQIDVWSEKCIPAGAVHLRLPRLGAIAQNLKISFAPAMVGFEIRQGRSVPVYEGIVVPVESQDAIMEVYMKEEGKRLAEMQRKQEQQAALRWRQLIRSIAIRQRLRASYEVEDAQFVQEHHQVSRSEKIKDNVEEVSDKHVHNFIEQDDDEQSGITIKRCACGFEVEEM